MKAIITQENQPELISILDMPEGSIGVVEPYSNLLYIIRTHGNGPEYIKIWPKADPVGIEMMTLKTVKEIQSIRDWKIKLLPQGGTLTLKFD